MAIPLYFFIFAASLAIFAEAQVDPHNCDSVVNLTISDACKGEVTSDMDNVQIDEILSAHKSLGNKPLTWSSDLAERAQAWANKCADDYDPCSSYPNSPVHQVLYRVINCGNTISLTQMIIGVFEGTNLPLYIFNSHRPVPSQEEMIGCGLLTSQEGNCLTKYLVCNHERRESSTAKPTN